MQNAMVRAITTKVRPAEVFYNTVSEEFSGHQNVEEFVGALKARMGPAWDDRLLPLARAFYNTAQAVTQIVGAGRFMGASLQLGKAKIQTAIDDLLERWDHALGITDDMVDKYLPESSEAAPRLTADAETDLDGENGAVFSMDDDFKGSSSDSSSSQRKRSRERSITATDVATTDSSSTEPELSPTSLTGITKRIRSVWALSTAFVSKLRRRLSKQRWFKLVDDILLQNPLVRAIAGSSDDSRPADHFFDTSVSMLSNETHTVDAFLSKLREKLGSSWDERLLPASKTFFSTAMCLAPKHRDSTQESMS